MFEADPNSEITQVLIWSAYCAEIEPHDSEENPALKAPDLIKTAMTAIPQAMPMVTESERKFIIRGMRLRDSTGESLFPFEIIASILIALCVLCSGESQISLSVARLFFAYRPYFVGVTLLSPPSPTSRSSRSSDTAFHATTVLLETVQVLALLCRDDRFAFFTPE